MSARALFILIYFICVSLVSVILTADDKRRARQNRRRISERTLFAWALLGGSLFEYLAMRAFHHKTLHKRFMIGLPMIFLFQIAVVVLIYMKFVKTGIIVI